MNGYIESDEHVEWRMNRRRLQNVEATYGEGWEQDADNIHALIAAAEAGDHDPRTEQEKAFDEFSAEVYATRASDAPVW